MADNANAVAEHGISRVDTYLKQDHVLDRYGDCKSSGYKHIPLAIRREAGNRVEKPEMGALMRVKVYYLDPILVVCDGRGWSHRAVNSGG